MDEPARDPRPYYQVDPRMDRYIPNVISPQRLWWNLGLSAMILLWGGLGLWADDLFIPGKRGGGVHFHGLAAFIMFGAMVAAALNLLILCVDHIDQRNNERSYRRAEFVTQVLGWGLFALALGVQWGR